jgi:hypothetical protein
VASTGNGNGYKMGGSDSANLSHTMILKKCLSFQNRVKGFDQNNNRGSMTILNCTAFGNGTNYGMSGPIDPGSTMTLKNCISAGTGSVSILSTAVQATNSWMPPFVVTSADFVSIDTTGVRGPRNPDGSLPDLPFMHLAQGSDLIDAGTNVGLPFLGMAPDLGAFEYDPSNAVEEGGNLPEGAVLSQNYPNPFNPATNFQFSISNCQLTILKVYDLLGREVATLVNEVKGPGTYTVQWDVRLHSARSGGQASGVYFYQLRAGAFAETKKLMVLQ